MSLGPPSNLTDVRRRLKAGHYDLETALEVAYTLGWDDRTVDLVRRLSLTPRYQTHGGVAAKI